MQPAPGFGDWQTLATPPTVGPGRIAFDEFSLEQDLGFVFQMGFG